MAEDLSRLRFALIGYGEVGRILGRALSAHRPASMRAFGKLQAPLARAREDGVEPTDSAVLAVKDADLVVC